MSIGSVTPALREFIARYIQSVEQVEILCLLEASPNKVWTPAEVFRVIQSSEKSVGECLEVFRNSGLLSFASGGTYQLASKTSAAGQLISELAAAYRERRVKVIETIYAKPSDPIQDFADAFKLRKEK